MRMPSPRLRRASVTAVATIAAVTMAVTGCASSAGDEAVASPTGGSAPDLSPVYDGSSKFVTLGTGAGGLPQVDRSQPANLLVTKDRHILVDAGAGAVNQLGKMSIPPSTIDTVVISHLHFDHTGGLFALLGLRLQVPGPEALTIYGPPGTKAMVDGLLAAVAPATRLFNARSQDFASGGEPANGVSVVEISDGGTVDIGAAKLTAAQNTHYSFPEGSSELVENVSLSYRFDLPDRSIGFTGDTGPSEKMTKLVAGVDLLVTEVIDADASLAVVTGQRPDLTEAGKKSVYQHFVDEHLTPAEIGRIAQAGKPGMVMLSHNALSGGARKTRSLRSHSPTAAP